MNAKFDFMNKLVNKNHETFNDFRNLKWINPYHAESAEIERDTLIKSFSQRVNWSFKATKPWINSISKGCELCGKGEWSCLFITGRCNANCFYCPTTQNSDDTPMAQQLSFENHDEYADFINYFKFKGCSFSGGEPFLVFDKVVKFLETLRKKCSPDLYIWMYTNGILGTEEKFNTLSKLGLNEVRFDIGATSYKIDTIKKAKGLIDNITVEIPMDPDKLDVLKELIPQLITTGVTNLNLHQMRLTSYNASKLQDRNYTFIHGEHPTVLESELAALELIKYVDSNKLGIGINYCGFQYKHRFQKAGYRLKILSKLKKDQEFSENGYLINIYVSSNVAPDKKFLHTKSIEELTLSGSIIKITVDQFLSDYKEYEYAIIQFNGLTLTDKPSSGMQNVSAPVRNRIYNLETGMPSNPAIIKKDKFDILVDLLNGEKNPLIEEDEDLFQIWKNYRIENSFRSYF